MPIKVKVHDNSSEVKVKPKSQGTIDIDSGGGINDKVLEAKIKAETEERIAADENLQSQIDTKQDEIQFVFIPNISGILEESKLNLLIGNQVNRLVFGTKVYYLSLRYGNIRKYFSTDQSSSLNEIDVDLGTGEYQVISTIDTALEAHMNDVSSHVSSDDRIFWNNKVTTKIDSENIENLILTKH